MSVTSPPEILKQAVFRETQGVKVLWSGRPEAWGYARRYWKHAWIGIPFTAFSVFWTWGAAGGFSRSGKGPPEFFVWWGSMFIVAGLCVLLSPFFALWKAGRVYYVVTEKSAIIFEKVWSIKIHAFHASAFNGFERISRGDRAGDILFQRKIERQGKGTRTTEIGFLGLTDFAEAERALNEMMEANAKLRPSIA